MPELSHYKAPNLNEMLETMTRDIVTGHQMYSIGPSVQFHNAVAQSDTCVYDYDLADSWVTKSRWTTLVNQYINQNALDTFLDSVEDRMSRPSSHGVAFLRSQTVKMRNATGNGKVARRWGSCMIGWSFRRVPYPQLTMHSRSTYLGFIAPLDVGVGHKIAELVGERVGLDLEQIGFNWHLEQGAFHAFRSMPWWWSDPSHTELLKEILKTSRVDPSRYPVGRHIDSTLRRYNRDDRNGVLYGDMAFAQHRRFRMLWHLKTKSPEFYEQFLGEGLYATQNAMPRVKPVMLSSLSLRSKNVEYNPDTEGTFEDDFCDCDTITTPEEN